MQKLLVVACRDKSDVIFVCGGGGGGAAERCGGCSGR